MCGVCGCGGDGPLMPVVKERARQLHISDHIKTLGFVREINDVIAAASIMMLTSRTEGIPMVILEAMGSNTPVVSADVGGIPAIIQTDYNGLLVSSRDPDDYARACQRLLGGADTTASITRNALETIRQQFSLASQQATYRQIYHGESA